MKGWNQEAVDKARVRINSGIKDFTHQPANRSIVVEGKSKFGSKIKEVDGIKFRSLKEAKRYRHLKILLKAGVIGFLKLQVPYELNTGGTHSLKYYADFVYTEAKTGKEIVEDVKGFRNQTYLKKKRLMLKVYGITIIET